MSFSKLDTSNKKDGADGSKWTSKLYFDRDCDNPNCAMSELTESALVQILNELVSDEKILQVQMWKHPLNPYQLSDLIVYHCFLVLETNEWWWSIEKNTEELTMQRCKNHEKVIKHYRRRPRTAGWKWLTDIRKMKSTKLPDADSKLSSFFDTLYKNNELRITYHRYNDNCKDFAQRLYNYFEKEQQEGRMRKLGEFLARKIGLS